MNARRTQQLHTHQSERFSRNRHRRLIVGLSATLIALISWLFVLSRLSDLQALAITDIRVYGADPDITGNLEAAASSSIQGSYLGIFSKSDSLIYPKAAVKQAVGSSSPRLATVNVMRNGLHGLTVSVTEKIPAAVICADLPNLDSGESGVPIDSTDCYLADRTGFIFKQASMASTSQDRNYDVYYAPNLQAVPVGTFATSTNEFASVVSFVSGVKAAGLAPQGVLIKDSGEYELYLRNPSNPEGPIIVYWDTSADVSRELSDLSAFWNGIASGSAKVAVKDPSQLEYIDIRYGSNVFYR